MIKATTTLSIWDFSFVNEKKKKALLMWPWTYRQYGHFGEVMKSLPFPLEVLDGTHKHNVLELVVVKVAGTEWHHQVPEANQGWTDIAKDADHHVATQDGHGGFTSSLPEGEGHRHWRDGVVKRTEKITCVKYQVNNCWVLTMCYYFFNFFMLYTCHIYL